MQARGFSFPISLSFKEYKYTTFFWNKQRITKLFSIIYAYFRSSRSSRSSSLRIFAFVKNNSKKTWQHLEEKEKLPNVKK